MCAGAVETAKRLAGQAIRPAMKPLRELVRFATSCLISDFAQVTMEASIEQLLKLFDATSCLSVGVAHLEV